MPAVGRPTLGALLSREAGRICPLRMPIHSQPPFGFERAALRRPSNRLGRRQTPAASNRTCPADRSSFCSFSAPVRAILSVFPRRKATCKSTSVWSENALPKTPMCVLVLHAIGGRLAASRAPCILTRCRFVAHAACLF